MMSGRIQQIFRIYFKTQALHTVQKGWEVFKVSIWDVMEKAKKNVCVSFLFTFYSPDSSSYHAFFS